MSQFEELSKLRAYLEELTLNIINIKKLINNIITGENFKIKDYDEYLNKLNRILIGTEKELNESIGAAYLLKPEINNKKPNSVIIRTLKNLKLHKNLGYDSRKYSFTIVPNIEKLNLFGINEVLIKFNEFRAEVLNSIGNCGIFSEIEMEDYLRTVIYDSANALTENIYEDDDRLTGTLGKAIEEIDNRLYLSSQKKSA